MVELRNDIELTGIYGDEDTPVSAEASATVLQVEGTLTKTASPQTWLGGDLTYTITFTNNEPEVGGLPIRTIVIADTIDISVVTLDEASINIAIAPGTALTNYTYDDTTGELEFTIDSLDPQNTATITFLVTKA